LSDLNPLVQRVDALLKRHHQQGATVQPADPDTTLDLRAVADAQTAAPSPSTVPAETAPAALPDAPPHAIQDDFPVLTEIVETAARPETGALDEAFAARVEAAVLERVLAGMDATLEHRMGRTISDLLEQAMDGLRADLAAGIRELVREAVATAVREELAARSGQD
jgi:predicted component of type VI protein secretion system